MCEEYKIVAKHKDNNYYEEVDAAESKEDADFLTSEYQMAYGPEWHVTCITPNQQP